MLLLEKNTELRKLPAGKLCNIVNILETDNDWKKIMSLIPRNPRSEYFEPKYNNEHINNIWFHTQNGTLISSCGHQLVAPYHTMYIKGRPTYLKKCRIAIASIVSPTLALYHIQKQMFAEERVPLDDNTGLGEQWCHLLQGKINIAYTNHSLIRLQIEDHARASSRKCAEILFEEWGTSGKVRPTLVTLRDVCTKATIYRAADEISSMIQESPPPRPQDGPAARIDTDILSTSTLQQPDSTAQIKTAPGKEHAESLGHKTTAEMVSEGRNTPNSSQDPQVPWQTWLPKIDSMLTKSNVAGIDSEILRNQELIDFPYKDLERITKRFTDKKIYIPDPNGGSGKLAGKIGSGGFGEVYAGFHTIYGQVAVKKARTHLVFDKKPDIAVKVFNAEVRFLAQFKHKNIVPIIGYSIDGPLCIVCEYIDGGSLQDKLAAKILTEKQRLKIMLGTAEGLKYLHESRKLESKKDNIDYEANDSEHFSKTGNFVHGDIKTANILLTRDFVPKICDFGLGKQYNTTCMTSSPMGSHAYMAPEGFKGTITQENDIYSYGIVLLEMLTGQGPIVHQHRETINIKDFVEENCPNNEIQNVLDPFIDKWTKGKEIYTLAKKCLEYRRKQRPNAEEIVDTLYTISGFEKDDDKGLPLTVLPSY